MELNELKAAIEAVLFAHGEPLSGAKLADILEVDQPLVERMLLMIRDDCEQEGRGIQLLKLEDAWQFATRPKQAAMIQKALDTRRNTPLSNAAMEVLAIIAYNQPVSRAFIEQVRGVDSSSTVANLVEKGLVAEAGRLDLPGKPVAFRTTEAFLRTFGISALYELPPLHDENTPEDESGLYARPAAMEARPEEELFLQAGSGEIPEEAGAFVEGEGGAALEPGQWADGGQVGPADADDLGTAEE